MLAKNVQRFKDKKVKEVAFFQVNPLDFLTQTTLNTLIPTKVFRTRSTWLTFNRANQMNSHTKIS